MLGVGASFTNTHFNAPVPQNVPLAQITNAVEDINKDHEIDHGLIGDAKLVLRQLIEEVKRQAGENGRGDVNGVIEEVATVKAEFMKEWGPHLTSDELPISPLPRAHGAHEGGRPGQLDRDARLRLSAGAVRPVLAVEHAPLLHRLG